ncbi:tyrosine-protein phosphatase [Viridibacillus sp. YIM B01967]|uniref:Tyrosine-protein phosphatase n=1 Tax=Viridibacillus soli TaxID=2798301 RepID=A0ABS1H5W2_9BACL|nr:tyrosine-protein phosphatase [Viridibacillus soli]MBK3494684.1 tyrosine-protein phosphatase [Viridibacillus soli]
MSNVNENRVLPLEQVVNFRDMGGYPTADGRKVKYGVFYRSGGLNKMTVADHELFKTLGIKTIFDYRDDGEAETKPDPIFENVHNERIPAKGDVGFQMPTSSLKEMDNRAFLQTVNADVFTKLYAHLPLDNPSYKRLMDIIQDPENLGLLHHCAVGKDRTGVGGALILLALGVDEENVMKDYLVTNDYMQPVRDAMIPMLSEHLNEEQLQHFGDIMSAKEQYLQATFDAINERYGNYDTFFEKEFGLTEEKRKTLQANCLE